MIRLGLFVVLAVGVASAEAQTTSLKTGKAVKVTPAATAQGAGQVRTLRVNDDVRQREVIRTTAGGEAQLLFDDGTKIAVGPGSELVLEDYVFAQRGRAEKVTINALSGSFRFISGRSRKGTYNIKTPSATLAIRGTAFDTTVSQAAGTEIVMYRGSVDLCSRQDPTSCVRVQGECQAASVPVGGAPGLIDSRQQRTEILRDRFQYSQSQDSLLSGFRVNTGACGTITRRATNDEPEEERVSIARSPSRGALPDPDLPDPPDESPDRDTAGREGDSRGGESRGGESRGGESRGGSRDGGRDSSR